MSSTEADFDFAAIPIRALNFSSRMTLSWFLNPEQPLRSTNGIARDYRGLAELMDFEINDIRNFQRSEDPTLKILEAWEKNASSTVGQLIKFLEQMDRFDVIEDTISHLKKDAQAFLRRNKSNENPIQVPEVTSCRPTVLNSENPNALTVTDVQSGECTYYDAYVCYAEENTPFVSELAKYLEAPQIGLKLFIKGRDLLLGTSEPDSLVQLIRDRCGRMLIILSPEFLESSACEFQTSFAAGLAIEQRQRKLIPVVIKPCEIPPILKYVSKIDFTKPVNQTWFWDKLIQSIRGTSSSIFVSSPYSMPFPKLAISSQSDLPLPSALNPVITFPPSIQHSIICSPSGQPAAILPSVPVTTESVSNQKLLPASTVNVVKNTPPTKHKWFQNIKGRFTSSSSSPSTIHASSSSAATSGYQSQNSFYSTRDLDNNNCEDTV